MLYPNNYWVPAYPESNRPWIYKMCPFCHGIWANLPWDIKYCPGCGHYMLKNEKTVKDKPSDNFTFCVECVKAMHCEKVKKEYIDGCKEGIAFYGS